MNSSRVAGSDGRSLKLNIFDGGETLFEIMILFEGVTICMIPFFIYSLWEDKQFWFNLIKCVLQLGMVYCLVIYYQKAREDDWNMDDDPDFQKNSNS